MNLFLPGEHYMKTVISNGQNHIDIVEPTTVESVNSEETILTELGVLSDADEISSSGVYLKKIKLIIKLITLEDIYIKNESNPNLF